MASKVFVVNVIFVHLCWTVDQLDTQPRDVTHQNASTSHFELCNLNIIHLGQYFTLYKQLSLISPLSGGKPVTDLWTSQCDIINRYKPGEAVKGNPLKNYKNDIKGVNITYSNITSFPSEYFCEFSNLTNLILSNNHLNDSAKFGLCDDNNCAINECGDQLTELNLSGNPLRVIRNNSFDHLERLQHLDLKNCQLTFIESGAFLPLKDLSTLDISTNFLTHLTMGMFQSNLQLWWLMNNNNSFDAIYDIQHFIGLSDLGFQHNFITKVWKDDFINCTEMTNLDLSHNDISKIENGAFDSMPKMEDLKLNNNRLQSLDKIFLHSKIKKLYLNYNQLTYIELGHLPRNIQEIYLAENFISRLGCKWCSAIPLELIDMSYNNFTQLDKLYLPQKVTTVILSNNDIDHISFSGSYGYDLARKLIAARG